MIPSHTKRTICSMFKHDYGLLFAAFAVLLQYFKLVCMFILALAIAMAVVVHCVMARSMSGRSGTIKYKHTITGMKLLMGFYNC